MAHGGKGSVSQVERGPPHHHDPPGEPQGTITHTAMAFDVRKTAVFGAAFGVAAVLAAVAVHWFASRPKGWDSNSIQCAKLTVVQTFTDVPSKFGPNGDPEHFEGSGFILEFVLENHTRTDYTVSQDLKLFARDDRSSALSELKVTLEHPYLIPAGERAEVAAAGPVPRR